jgi:hypothetical protein
MDHNGADAVSPGSAYFSVSKYTLKYLCRIQFLSSEEIMLFFGTPSM